MYLADFSLIFGPPGTQLGLPGSSKMAYNIKATYQQNFTSLWELAELTFACRYAKLQKSVHLVDFGLIFGPPGARQDPLVHQK